MIEQKIEKLIEEATHEQYPNRYIYHYSSKKFPEIKNLEMQGIYPKGDWVKKISDIESYRKTFSGVLEPLAAKDIARHRSAGFKNWGSGPIYEYKIDILKNKEAFDGPIKITSIPEREDFRAKEWAQFIKRKGVDFQRMNHDDDYWESVKDKYFDLIRKYWDSEFEKRLKKDYGVLTPEVYVRSPRITHLRNNWTKFIDKNIKKGNKDQYATYIPHIHTKIKKPLIPDKIRRIT
jgi:hypothetical protein